MLVLLFVALHSTRRFVLSLALCYFVLVFFSPFSIAITSLGEEKTKLFVPFVLVWFCLLSSSWCLRKAAVCDCGIPWTFIFFGGNDAEWEKGREGQVSESLHYTNV